MKGGPGDAAGMRPGDVVVEFGGVPIKEVPDLQRRVASVTPGQPTKLTVIRERRPVGLTVIIGEMPGDEPTVAAEHGAESWGLSVEPLGADSALRLNLSHSHGVVVTDVMPGSPADRAGLRRGDVILEINRRSVGDPGALARDLAAVPAGHSVLVYVHRPGGSGGRNEYLVMGPTRP